MFRRTLTTNFCQTTLVFLCLSPFSWTQEPTQNHLPVVLMCVENQDTKIRKKVSYTASLEVRRDLREPALLNNLCQSRRQTTTSRVRFKRRGASSDKFKKKQYSVEFIDQDGFGINREFLGMPAGKKWVFNAPYVDRALIRNALGFEIGRQVGALRGDSWAAPRTRFFELILNDRYVGVYLAIEKIRRQPRRLNLPKTRITQPSEAAIIGEISALDGPLQTSLGTRLQLNYPSQKKFTLWGLSKPFESQVMQAQIMGHLNRLEKSLWQINHGNTCEADDSVHYSELLDVESFVDYFLLQEAFKNVDGFRRSMFFYREPSPRSKFKMGPLWDFNLAMGNLRFEGLSRTNGWAYRDRLNPVYWLIRNSFWFQSLTEDPTFVNQLISRYKELRQPGMPLNHASVADTIDSLLVTLGPDAAERDRQLWSKEHRFFERRFMTTKEKGDSHSDHVEILRHWLILRLQWMDRHITDLLPKKNLASVGSMDLESSGAGLHSERVRASNKVSWNQPSE